MQSKQQKLKAAAVALIICAVAKNEQDAGGAAPARKKRRIWSRQWLEKRETDGAHNKLLQEFRMIENQKHLF